MIDIYVLFLRIKTRWLCGTIIQRVTNMKDTRNEQYKALALSVSDNMDGKVYAVVKNELDELMKLSNEYFDVRHNDYLNAAKEKREPLNDSQFIWNSFRPGIFVSNERMER